MPMIIESKRFNYYSPGKLLITGEYLVLDGALALAVPTLKGQSLSVIRENTGRQSLEWQSFTVDGRRWFTGHFDLPSGKYLGGSDEKVGQRLEQIFTAAKTLKPILWEEASGWSYKVRTDLEFSRHWGLGTSSTLIANLAKWWEVDPYSLLAKTFGGSGYDLACATASGPIFYQLKKGIPQVRPADFKPSFAPYLHFLYLEQKQDSRSGIAQYRQREKAKRRHIERLSELSRQAAAAPTLNAFEEVLEEHEEIISDLIGIEPVKKRLFADFPGTLKSLGAWGGDFVLVAGRKAPEDLKAYFSARGFPTLVPFEEIVLSNA